MSELAQLLATHEILCNRLEAMTEAYVKLGKEYKKVKAENLAMKAEMELQREEYKKLQMSLRTPMLIGTLPRIGNEEPKTLLQFATEMGVRPPA